MTFFRDAPRWTPEQRAAIAARLQQVHDVAPWPDLEHWNAAPCAKHSQLTAGCRYCGVVLRRHQRTGAAWLYVVRRGMLADSVGLGKTHQIAAVLAMMCQTGELEERRVVVVCRAAAVEQWRAEISRAVPGLWVIAAAGTPRYRQARYTEPWQVAIVSPQTLAGGRGAKRQIAGDLDVLRRFPLAAVVYDDIDAMRNARNRQAYAIRKLAENAPRCYAVHGTPLQKRLTELYSFLEPLGGREVLGTPPAFERRFVQKNAVHFYQSGLVCPAGHLSPAASHRCMHRPEGSALACGQPVRPDPQHRKVLRTVAREVGIIPARVGEFRALLAPFVLRRKAEDVEDAALPAISPSHVWLDLTPAQKTRYEEIRAGVLRMLREQGEEISHVEAMARFTRARQVCSGLASLDGAERGIDSSAKLDWVVDKLTGDLSEEKAVVFVYFTPNVDALAARLAREGVPAVVIKGSTPRPERAAALAAFTDAPVARCQVLIGTTSIEQSLNLQVARHLICVDSIINPARMEQLAGRVRRMGSAFATVYVHMLMLRATLEEGFLGILESEQALADTVWEESSELFDTLSARQLLELIARCR